MNKYRKKALITAEQWWPGEKVDGVVPKDPPGPYGAGEYVIHTLEGPLHVSPGDWIATGIQGEKWPIKDEIFRETYELVEG